MRPLRLALTLAVVACVSRTVNAADDTALTLVPADASFYTSSLRLGEQMEMFLKSNAYAKLKELPAAKLAAEHLREAAGRPDNPFGQFMQTLHGPGNQELVELLHDLPRQEIFVYGGANWARLLPVMMDL